MRKQGLLDGHELRHVRVKVLVRSEVVDEAGRGLVLHLLRTQLRILEGHVLERAAARDEEELIADVLRVVDIPEDEEGVGHHHN